MRHQFSIKSGVFLLLLLGIGLLILFGLAQQRLPLTTRNRAPQVAFSQIATPLPAELWPTPLPGVTNTPPTPTPGILVPVEEWPRDFLDQLPPGVEIVTSTYAVEWRYPGSPTVWVSPTATRPWPTATPRPTVSPDNKSPYAAHNLVLLPGPTAVSPKLRGPDSKLISDAVWSPDGSLMAVSEGVGEYQFYSKGNGLGTSQRPNFVFLFDAMGREINSLVEGQAPLWSPTGEYIAVYDWHQERKTGTIKIAEVDTRKVVHITTITEQNVLPTMTWISKTELLFFLGSFERGELLVFDLVTNAQHPFLTGAVAEEIAKDIDGELLYNISSFPSKGLIAIATSEILFILRQNEAGLEIAHKVVGFDIGPVIFSPDGEAIAYRSESRIQIALLNQWDQEPIHAGISGWPKTWAPDGSSLVFMSDDGVWGIINRDGSGLRPLTELPERTLEVVWTTQGLWAVKSGNDNKYTPFVVASQP